MGVKLDNLHRESLPEAYRSVSLPSLKSGWFRRFLAYSGPGYLVSVGYMDPGNWATDLAGGSAYGYRLLWVILLSNLFAQVLQVLCVRLGLVAGKDLAQACRDNTRRPAAIALWLIAEVAIIACDLAEVIGSAIALNLLFHIPIILGVILTGADVLLLLGLMKYGFRKLEAVVITLVGTITGCFALNIWMAKPVWGSVVSGMLIPSLPDRDALVIALGILGATVMPHNLYLHSSLVQTRKTNQDEAGLKDAIRNNTWDTVIALSFAFLVNAAIMIVAGAVFYKTGKTVEELQQAHTLLTPLLGGAAATAFAVALLASGQSSTITGTLAGQIVMEGFLQIRVSPWVRRIVTRTLAIVPAVIMMYASGGTGTVRLLILSQVVLSLQLSFAIFPLMMYTSSAELMGKYANPLWLKITGYGICFLIAGLNFYLLYQNVNLALLIAGCVAGLVFAAYVKWGYREPGRSGAAAKTP